MTLRTVAIIGLLVSESLCGILGPRQIGYPSFAVNWNSSSTVTSSTVPYLAPGASGSSTSLSKPVPISSTSTQISVQDSTVYTSSISKSAFSSVQLSSTSSSGSSPSTALSQSLSIPDSSLCSDSTSSITPPQSSSTLIPSSSSISTSSITLPNYTSFPTPPSRISLTSRNVSSTSETIFASTSYDTEPLQSESVSPDGISIVPSAIFSSTAPPPVLQDATKPATLSGYHVLGPSNASSLGSSYTTLSSPAETSTASASLWGSNTTSLLSTSSSSIPLTYPTTEATTAKPLPSPMSANSTSEFTSLVSVNSPSQGASQVPDNSTSQATNAVYTSAHSEVTSLAYNSSVPQAMDLESTNSTFESTLTVVPDVSSPPAYVLSTSTLVLSGTAGIFYSINGSFFASGSAPSYFPPPVGPVTASRSTSSWILNDTASYTPTDFPSVMSGSTPYPQPATVSSSGVPTNSANITSSPSVLPSNTVFQPSGQITGSVLPHGTSLAGNLEYSTGGYNATVIWQPSRGPPQGTAPPLPPPPMGSTSSSNPGLPPPDKFSANVGFCGGTTVNIPNATLNWWYSTDLDFAVATFSAQYNKHNNSVTGWTVLAATTTFNVTSALAEPTSVVATDYNSWVNSSSTYSYSYTTDPPDYVSTAVITQTATNPLDTSSGTGSTIPSDVIATPAPASTVIPGPSSADAVTALTNTPFVYFSSFAIDVEKPTRIENGSMACSTSRQIHALPSAFALYYADEDPEGQSQVTGDLPDEFLDELHALHMPVARIKLGTYAAEPTLLVVVEEVYVAQAALALATAEAQSSLLLPSSTAAASSYFSLTPSVEHTQLSLLLPISTSGNYIKPTGVGQIEVTAGSLLLPSPTTNLKIPQITGTVRSPSIIPFTAVVGHSGTTLLAPSNDGGIITTTIQGNIVVTAKAITSNGASPATAIEVQQATSTSGIDLGAIGGIIGAIQSGAGAQASNTAGSSSDSGSGNGETSSNNGGSSGGSSNSGSSGSESSGSGSSGTSGSNAGSSGAGTSGSGSAGSAGSAGSGSSGSTSSGSKSSDSGSSGLSSGSSGSQNSGSGSNGGTLGSGTNSGSTGSGLDILFSAISRIGQSSVPQATAGSGTGLSQNNGAGMGSSGNSQTGGSSSGGSSSGGSSSGGSSSGGSSSGGSSSGDSSSGGSSSGDSSSGGPSSAGSSSDGSTSGNSQNGGSSSSGTSPGKTSGSSSSSGGSSSGGSGGFGSTPGNGKASSNDNTDSGSRSSGTVLIGVPVAVGGSEITIWPSSNAVFGSQTLSPGGPAITISGTPVSLEPSAVVVGIETYSFSISSVQAPSPILSSEDSQSGSASGVPAVITIGKSTITQAPIPVYMIGGQTLQPGQTVTINNKVASIGSGGALVIDGSSVSMAVPGSPETFIAAGETIVVSSTPAYVLGDGQTLLPGGSAVTVSGKQLSLAPSASALVIDGSVSQLVSPATHVPLVLTIGSEVLTANAATQFLLPSGTILTPGGEATVSGTTIRLDSGGSVAVVNQVTQTLSPPIITPAPRLTAGGTVFEPNLGSTFDIAGQELTPGGVITASGTTISLASDASLAVINGVTETLSIPTNKASAPSQTPAAVLTLGGKVFTAVSGSTFVISGSTLSPGGVLTLGSGSSATTVSLGVSGAGTVVIDGVTSKLSSAAAFTTPPLTIAGQVYSADTSGGYLIGDQTLVPAGNAITFTANGNVETASLSPGGSILVLNGFTSTITAGRSATTPEPLTINSQVYPALPASGSARYVISGQTLTPGGNAITFTANGVVETVSLNRGGNVLIVNGVPSTYSAVGSAATPLPITIGGQLYSASLADSAPTYVISGQTLTEGGIITFTDKAGVETVSLVPGGGALVINGATSTIDPHDAAITAGPITIDGQIYSTISGMDNVAYIISGQTLTEGGVVTFTDKNGIETVSLVPGGSALVINGATSTIAPQEATITPGPITIDGQIYSTVSGLDSVAYIISGQTLTEGGVLTFTDQNGVETVSLSPGGTVVIINGVSSTIAPAPTITAAPEITVDGQIITPIAGSGTTYLVSGKVLTPGGSVVFNGINGVETVSLSPDGSTLVEAVSGAVTTSALPTAFAIAQTAAPVITVGDETFTALPGPGPSYLLPDGQTLHPGGRALTETIHGSVYILSLSPSATILVIEDVGPNGVVTRTDLETLFPATLTRGRGTATITKSIDGSGAGAGTSTQTAEAGASHTGDPASLQGTAVSNKKIGGSIAAGALGVALFAILL